MDFQANRSTQPQTVAPSAHSAPATSSKKGGDKGKWGRILLVTGVALATVLLLGVIYVAAFANNTANNEDQYVDSTKLQAVFLNTGQVYFGNVKKLNTSYIVLSNIYYLQTSSTGTSANASTSVSLVKLGCELHEPYDQMVINRSQVTFWENLQDNGQVATAVSKFEKANPNGQKCADQSSSSSTNSSSSVQNAPTTSSGTKP
jgi:hypothetical protein